MSQLLIIGGGITGLAAAWEAVQFPRVEVTLIDAQPRLGGKILGSEIAIADEQSLMIDEGADFRTFRIGLFGLDKLKDIPGTLKRLEAALDAVA